MTGTNGKTSTTALVAAALARAHAPVVRVTTVGCFLDEERLDVSFDHTGFVAAMRIGVERGGRFAAIELTSEALALGFAKAWPCRVGVFTNLTRDHFDAHKSAEHYLASKAQLFMGLPRDGAAVLNGCDPASLLLADVVPPGVRAVRYGVATRGAPVAPLDVEGVYPTVSWTGTRITLRSAGAFGTLPDVLTTRAIGHVFAENALAAFAAALCAGVAPEAAVEGIAAASPPPGRFEVVRERPYVVVDYAHTPDALSRTLAAARALVLGQVWVVFGAGGHRDRDKRPLMGKAAEGADRIVLTSDNPRDEDPAAIAAQIRSGIADNRRAGLEIELDRAQAITSAVVGAAPDDVIVVAGKGHEGEQIFADRRVPFSDRDVARAAIRR